jgi:hypothetical protein
LAGDVDAVGGGDGLGLFVERAVSWGGPFLGFRGGIGGKRRGDIRMDLRL